jgi:hypothetical protein
VTAAITIISALIGVLLSLGKQGTQVAGTLAFGISMMSFLFTLADRLVLSNQALTAGSAPPFSLSRRTVLLLALAASVVIGSLGAVGYYKLLRRPDIHFANRISVEHDKGLTDTGQATIHVPGDPPTRRYLTLTPQLTNTSPVGDCVGSAHLDVALIRDGRWHTVGTNLTPRTPINFDLAGTSQDASVAINVYMADTACVVDLDFTEAVLYNKFWRN